MPVATHVRRQYRRLKRVLRSSTAQPNSVGLSVKRKTCKAASTLGKNSAAACCGLFKISGSGSVAHPASAHSDMAAAKRLGAEAQVPDNQRNLCRRRHSADPGSGRFAIKSAGHLIVLPQRGGGS